MNVNAINLLKDNPDKVNISTMSINKNAIELLKYAIKKMEPFYYLNTNYLVDNENKEQLFQYDERLRNMCKDKLAF
jgi:hypothetical protein